MNYRHSYHAGNFADVFKHVILVILIESLKRKESPFCYLDTHAGAGKYNLRAAAAQKTREYQGGIDRLLQVTQPLAEIKAFLDIVAGLNGHQSLVYYPGSPYIASSLLREQDRAIFMELQLDVFQELKAELAHKQRAIHHLDGYQGVKAFIPPKERRGLLFIDSAFEQQQEEFEKIFQAVTLAYQRWRQGMMAVWYPIKERKDINRFHQQLQTSGLKKILLAELCVLPDDSRLGLNGAGMIIINPPWQLDEQLQKLLPQLLSILSLGNPKEKVQVKWLVEG
jgi:23S rRNA (adenine2030-N6)-methyltransferase